MSPAEQLRDCNFLQFRFGQAIVGRMYGGLRDESKHTRLGFWFGWRLPWKSRWRNMVMCVHGISGVYDGTGHIRRPDGRYVMMWSLSVPFWVPLLLLSVYPGTQAALLLRRRRRHRPGHCQHCGYDLTGNVSGRCPECGATA